MKLIEAVAKFFSRRPFWQYFLLFVITATLFSYLQSDQTFADPDSFYHAKMAVLIAEHGPVFNFPWLTTTTLKANFVDHHFLYHLFLVPFVALFSPLIGLKVATVILSTLAILAAFLLLRTLKVKGAFWFAFFLLTVNPFVFRLNLAKATGLALILAFAISYLIFNRKYLALLILSAIYVWAYGGWTLALLLVIIYSLVSAIWGVYHGGFLARYFRRRRIFKQNARLFASVIGGLAAGVVINPYFPKNIMFFWEQSFKIAVVNYQYVIGVGGEWYPYALTDLLPAAGPMFILATVAILGFIFYYRRQTQNSWFYFVLAFIFFGLTLKSRRYVEYFVPFTVIFSALSINAFWNPLKKTLSRLVNEKHLILIPLILLAAGLPLFYFDIQSIKDSYAGAFSFDKFSGACDWLNENSESGDIIFHTDWDEFPLLFYHNDKDYYLVGLDPTFMYDYDRVSYRLWLDLVVGTTSRNIYKTIHQIFGAKYVFVDYNENQIFDGNLAANYNFTEVYRDAEAKIYKVGQ